ncbi:MAG: NUDIX domain-containing protein [Gemmatimonadota bacterium]
MSPLAATKNKYDGIYIHPDELPSDPNQFVEDLLASLELWRNDGIAAVWLSLPAPHSHLSSAALRCGFEYHHCAASELMLVQRLVPDSPLPSFATHTIGAGGLVLSGNKEILTVVERQDLVARPDHLKLPGGMLEPGEHVANGVVREVLEETGIQTEFESIVGFRHHHGGQFGTSNIYFVCTLRPLSFDITIDEAEIGRALWMPVDEYLANDGVGLLNKHVVRETLRSSGLTSMKLEGYRSSSHEYEVYSPAP